MSDRLIVRLLAGGALLSQCCIAADNASPHWAYQPLKRVELPPITNHQSRIASPIDAFVVARLEANGVAPAREADKRTLLRRVYFNLIGLPPTSEEMRAFLEDASTNAYERVVEHLLASPRYGERWARHWMDVVHFAETHGHDQDRIRTNAWPYRDYLIRSFNDDKPYARFVQEQVAGDALFPDDPQATVALGMIAAGPWDESSLRDIREDTLDRQIGRYLDRDDMLTTVMQTFTSTTVHCARCHDHKFDPIPQRDYYALQAVFAGVDRANRSYDSDPAMHARRQKLLRDKKRVEQNDRELLLAETTQRDVQKWERGQAANATAWRFVEPQTFVSTGGATLTRQPDGSLLASGARPERDTYTISADSPLKTISAVRLETLADASLPKSGPGRQDNGNFHLSEFEVLLFAPGATNARKLELASSTADFNQSGWTIEHALDGNEKTAWGIYPKVGASHQAVFALKEPLRIPEGATFVFVLKQLHGDGHLIGRPRLAVSDAPAASIATPIPDGIAKVLATSSDKRSEEERMLVAAFVLKQGIARELATLPRPSLVYAAATDFEADGGLKPSGGPRPVHMLRRGDIKRPLEPAVPGSLTCISNLTGRFELSNTDGEGARRAALARWLADADNPLTWRSVVNRVWHYHFGRGLVNTPNDFGRMGATPSHPELLDWLAVWFRDEARGSLKQLHRLIVTSATYRQSSVFSNQYSVKETSGDSTEDWKLNTEYLSRAKRADADNKLLWHVPRARLDAEQVRDALLQISGCLDLRMGGPGDMQFDLQPGHHVTPKVDYTQFDVTSPAAQRRSVYRFLFRTLPDPFMDALDCPAGDQLTPARNASVTVQQALAMWNNAFVLHYAGKFAEQLESLAKNSDEQITLAYDVALNRPATVEERKDAADYVSKHGLANFCRVLLNSNEFMFVN